MFTKRPGANAARAFVLMVVPAECYVLLSAITVRFPMLNGCGGTCGSKAARNIDYETH